ncbi:glycosyltransferase [Acetobacterium fimetarium]|nr:glycosyltransferase [Acetobacterium fimetarium]
MNKKKHICIITYGYPFDKKPHSYTFVDKLVCAMADQDVTCTVINPIGKTFDKNNEMPPVRWKKKTAKGNEIELFCPRYLYFYTKQVGKFNTGIFTFHLFKKAVKKTLKKYQIKPDCLYAHFIFPAGATAAIIGNELKLPVFFAYGESTPWGIKIFGKKRLKKYFESINGVVAVSTAKKNELLSFSIVSEDKVAIFLNAIDETVFYPRSREAMRRRYGFSKEDFIVAFTGNFNESKGVMRLLEAANKDKKIKLALIGNGKFKPEGENIVFKGILPHNEVPLMLSACDIFVLPTLNEGCSNAIIEAMACGLPIVSSDRAFNYDILNENNAILVEPENVDEIYEAIARLMKSAEMRSTFSEKSLEISKKLTIEKRAIDILKWMESKNKTD